MKKIVFLHIPKSAGSTIQTIFKRQYKNNSFFVPGSHPDLDVIKEKIDSKNNLGLCFGHMDFGIHELTGKNCKYATIIRDPVERIISHYYYVKRQPDHYLHSQAFKKNNFSLAEYVKNGLSRELDNGQVRILIGAGGFHKKEYTKYDVPFGECEPWMLEEAKSNIKKHFVLCGLQEYFDESLVLLRKELRWKWNIGYVSQNITHQRKKVSELDAMTLEIIRDSNKLDVELYEWAKAGFLSKIAQEGPYVKKALQRLEWASLIEYYKYETKNIARKIFKFKDGH